MALVALLFVLCLIGCDLPPSPQVSSEQTIAGRVLAPTDGRLARDGSVSIAVDALIDPSSLFGADTTIRSGERELGVYLHFDPATRILLAHPAPSLLDPDLDYALRVAGPRTFDGRTLEPIELPLRVVRESAPVQPAPSHADVLEVLDGCRGCHEGATAAAGLDVTDLRGTAIGVRASELAPSSLGREGSLLIEPFHPERSDLVYKMLGEGPIVGAPMGTSDAPDVPLPRASIAIVTAWIAAGAETSDGEQP